MIAALSLAACVLFVPIDDDPWVALTVRGFSIAFVLAFALTDYKHWIVGGCLGASILLMAPSIIGEDSGLPGIGLAVIAGILSVFCQLGAIGREKTSVIKLCISPLLLLCAYWGLVLLNSSLDANAQTLLGYCLMLTVLAVIFGGQPQAVRDALIFVSFFVAALGYAYLLTNAIYFAAGIEPVKLQNSTYGLREAFGYTAWGPLVITNSSTLFGETMRASEITGEPGAWALYGALGVGISGVLFRGAPSVRRFAVIGGLVAIVSSQSAGALISLIVAAAAALAWSASRGSGRGKGQRVPLVILVILLMVATPFALRFLTELKAEGNVSSLIDRGIGFLSGVQGSSADSRISLLSSISVDGFIAALPILGIIVLLLWLRNNPYSFGLGVFFLLMGLVIQPVQWHIGIWFACVLLAMISTQGADGNERLRRRPDDSLSRSSIASIK